MSYSQAPLELVSQPANVVQSSAPGAFFSACQCCTIKRPWSFFLSLQILYNQAPRKLNLSPPYMFGQAVAPRLKNVLAFLSLMCQFKVQSKLTPSALMANYFVRLTAWCHAQANLYNTVGTANAACVRT